MSQAPRAKRFQFHLSTAVMMIFAAAILMWMNLGACRLVQESFYPNTRWDGRVVYRGFGWPHIAAGAQSYIEIDKSTRRYRDDIGPLNCEALVIVSISFRFFARVLSRSKLQKAQETSQGCASIRMHFITGVVLFLSLAAMIGLNGTGKSDSSHILNWPFLIRPWGYVANPTPSEWCLPVDILIEVTALLLIWMALERWIAHNRKVPEPSSSSS